MKDYKFQSECLNNIRAAVIERAIYDYREALLHNRLRKAWAIEGFFLSEEGQAFTRGNGEKIIERVRKEVGINDTGRSNEKNEDQTRGDS